MSEEFPFVENPEAVWGGEPLEQSQQNQEDQVSESQMAQAIALAEQGQSIEQIIGGLFANLPEHVKQQIRQRLAQAVQEKEARDHQMAQQTQEKQEKKAFSKLFSLSMLSGVISKETLERVQVLFSKNPNLKVEVSRQGRQMIEKGVQPDMEAIAQSSAVASPGIAQTQQKQKEAQR